MEEGTSCPGSALDRMVSDAAVHASRSGLKLPWGLEWLHLVCSDGKNHQSLPVVEQCLSLADYPGAKSS